MTSRAQRCTARGCRRTRKSRGLCSSHYMKRYRRGKIQPRAFPETCTVEGCGEPHEAKGYCISHYARWRRHGDPLVTKRQYTPEDRFAARFEVQSDGCWIWTGAHNRAGYGQMRRGDRTTPPMLAHRYSFERHHGRPVTEGLGLHHQCHRRACVNPAHLIEISRSEHQKLHARERRAG